MAENRRGKDRRYYFTLGQMLWLGTAFTLTCIVIFFLGIFIGKQIEARKMVRPEEPLIKMPVKPSTQGSAGTAGAAPKEELTFYETLTKSPQSQPALEEKGKDKDDKEPGKPLKREFKETKSEPSHDAAPAPRKAMEKKPEAATPLAVTATTQTAATAERKENGKVWTVQVNAYPDERSAKLLVDRLKNKGYNAVMTETRNKGKIWYRVRVGRYGSREEADEAVGDLKSKEKLEKAFATSRQQ
jgi:cell division septation protein DedD